MIAKKNVCGLHFDQCADVGQKANFQQLSNGQMLNARLLFVPGIK